jgi:6-phosphogluconolactonase (cycloisomerase 2 family)
LNAAPLPFGHGSGRARRSVARAGAAIVVTGAVALAAVAALTSADACAGAAPRPRRSAWLYVTNWGSDDVSAFRIGKDGSLAAPLVTPAPPGAHNPLAAVLDPRSSSLYVSNWGSGDLSRFQVAPDGRVVADRTVAPTAPLPENPAGVARSPDGRSLYFAAFSNGGSGTVSSFSIERDGTVSSLGPSIGTHGAGSAGVALHPDGRTVYVANMTSNDVSVFRRGAAGRLAWLETVSAERGAFFPAVTTDGRHLLVADALDDTIAVYRISGAGYLTMVGEPVPSGGPGPRGIALSPDGTRVYVAHYNGGTGPGVVTSLTIDRTGRLTPIGTAVSTGGNGAEAITLDPSGRYLYVANFNSGADGTVSVFAIGRAGVPTLRGEPIRTGGREPDFGGMVFAPSNE